MNAEIKRLMEKLEEHSPLGTSEADANDGAYQDRPWFESILATRNVLRVLPLLVTDERIGDQVKSRFVLSVFHTLAAAWTRTEFPELVSSNLSVAAARDIRPFAPASPSAAFFIGQAAGHTANSASSQDRGAAASLARAAAKYDRRFMR